MKTTIALTVLLFCFATAVLADEASDGLELPGANSIRFFETEIRSLLANHCYDCHNEDAQEDEWRLDSLRGMRSMMTIQKMPSTGLWSGCSTHHTTASLGAVTGSTLLATRTPTDLTKTPLTETHGGVGTTSCNRCC